MRRLAVWLILLGLGALLPQTLRAQDFDGFGTTMSGDEMSSNDSIARGLKRSTWGRDTSQVERFVPTEYRQWRINERLGTVYPEVYNDTLPHLFQNFNSTDGYTGEYSYLGNLGAPRLARNFMDRPVTDDLMFIQPYDYFHTTPGNLLFTNTKSPLTNLQYHKCGTKENGQDRLRAYFATNINKNAGLGFKADYLYARGYYNNQANSEFGGTLFGYFKSDHYDVHAMASWEHMKMAENGGIEDDAYIIDPQSFPRSFSSTDIPTVLSSLWNRNDHQTVFLTHRYNIGRYVEVAVPDSLKPKMPSDDELLQRLRSDSLVAAIRADSLRCDSTLDSLRIQWQVEQAPPREFVPVTSIIHTAHFRRLMHVNYSRAALPTDYFSHDPYIRSAYGNYEDETRAFSLKNTVGVQLREGFNRWAKAGITLFAAHEHERFRLPSLSTTDDVNYFDTYRENHISVGGEIEKTQGSLIHYKAGAEFWAIGQKAGDLDIHGTGDLNFRLGRDTVRLAATAAFQNLSAPFYYTHFHSQGIWWDNDLKQETRTRVEGRLTLDRTHTSLRFGMENISNYTHLASLLTPLYDTDGTTLTSYAHDVAVRQQSGSIQVLSATLRQGIHWGFFHWENEVTWQHTTNDDVLPLPTISLYTNPYVVFHIAKVLRVEIGVDMRYFTSYYAPDYSPFIGQFMVQDAAQPRVKLGNYPILNGYANFAIKRVRGYINVTHFNAGNGNAFWAPHYPIDPLSIHFGISWNFYD
ncbi:MAG: putative porin [Bacteroidaceae bacterium]|nr:putative porin [Bacteroidaceae bacterium]